jgi:hypothetical protein
MSDTPTINGDARSLVLASLPLYGSATLVDRSLSSGWGALDNEIRYFAYVNLLNRIAADGGNAKLERLALRLIGDFHAESESTIAGDLPLFPALVDKLSRSARLGTLRSLVLNPSVDGTALDRLTQHRDERVRTCATAARWTELDDQLERAGTVNLETVHRWCRTNPSFLAAMLDDPASVIHTNHPQLNDFPKFWPSNLNNGADGLDVIEDHFVELIGSITNKPASIRSNMEEYLEDAELSDRLKREIVAQYGTYRTHEFTAYVKREFLHKHPDDSYSTVIPLSLSSRERIVWSDAETVLLAATHPHTREWAFGSPLLDKERLAQYVAMVCIERKLEPHQHGTQSRFASWLAVNPNLSISQAGMLSSVTNDADMVQFTHAPLNTATRVAVLRRSVRMLELLTRQQWRNQRANETPLWWSAWMTRDVVEAVLASPPDDDLIRYEYGEWIRCVAGLYPDLTPAAADSLKTGDRIDSRLGMRVAEQLAEQLGEDDDAAEVFSGLLQSWLGGFTQLSSASKRLGRSAS